ncbi:MAG: tetratricopeptide repeat protein [Pseudomonadota bacterium]|nr:tetratricopeptide repeat protein [Pseudomonadota bacterium]
MMAVAALAAMIGSAWAQDDASRSALSHAIQQYLAGDAAAARAELQVLLAQGPSLAPEVRREALLWLGDLLYAEGGPDAARNVFESLLGEAPDYPIDRFAHSPEVVAFFEGLRATVVAKPPPRPPELDPEPTPWPWTVLLPGGVGYFIDKKPLAGAIVGGLQVAGFTVSVATYLELRDSYPGDYPNPAQFPEEHPEALDTFRTLETVNRVSVAAAALAYLVPIPIETGVWAGRRRVTMYVGPTSVAFSGRF